MTTYCVSINDRLGERNTEFVVDDQNKPEDHEERIENERDEQVQMKSDSMLGHQSSEREMKKSIDYFITGLGCVKRDSCPVPYITHTIIVVILLGPFQNCQLIHKGTNRIRWEGGGMVLLSFHDFILFWKYENNDDEINISLGEGGPEQRRLWTLVKILTISKALSD